MEQMLAEIPVHPRHIGRKELSARLGTSKLVVTKMVWSLHPGLLLCEDDDEELSWLTEEAKQDFLKEAK